MLILKASVISMIYKLYGYNKNRYNFYKNEF